MSQKPKLPSSRKVYPVTNSGEASPVQTQQIESSKSVSEDKQQKKNDDIKLITDDYPPITQEIMKLKEKLQLVDKDSLSFKEIEKDDVYFYGDVMFNMKCGFGKQFNKNTLCYYQGEFFMDQFHGKGTLIYQDGTIKQGVFFQGRLVDDVFPFLQLSYDLKLDTFQNCPNGANFTGLLDENGKRNGIGKYIWQDGSIYFGEFSDDSFNGYGQMSFANGNVYLGEWKNGQMQGIGHFIWKSNNQEYIGEYKRNKKNGFGINKFADGRRYIGYFRDGQFDGQAILQKKNHLDKISYWQNGNQIVEPTQYTCEDNF
ncbi:unnamed protein product [Paramecium pentaurelia]|uniref:MORN repeat protein n=1 Tax=Paramecium pentaurelia TaxID=43138 RepID=A0A8S1V0R6_9CILI|nr:unnamed protein product [Paramecium pentaurelia]